MTVTLVTLPKILYEIIISIIATDGVQQDSTEYSQNKILINLIIYHSEPRLEFVFHVQNKTEVV